MVLDKSICANRLFRTAPSWHRGQQSLRGGVIDHFGNFSCDDIDVTNIVVNHVLRLVTAAWHGMAVGPFEEPVVLVVALNSKAAFVHQSMVARAQQQQVIETRFTTGRPVLDVVGIHKSRVVTARERAACVSRS